MEWQRVGALRHGDLRHEGWPDARLVEDLRRSIRGDDGLAAFAAQLLLDVQLPLDDGGDELVQLGRQTSIPGRLVRRSKPAWSSE
jgi:hypothetical protein